MLGSVIKNSSNDKNFAPWAVRICTFTVHGIARSWTITRCPPIDGVRIWFLSPLKCFFQIFTFFQARSYLGLAYNVSCSFPCSYMVSLRIFVFLIPCCGYWEIPVIMAGLNYFTIYNSWATSFLLFILLWFSQSIILTVVCYHFTIQAIE